MQRLSDNSYRFSTRYLIEYRDGDFAAWCELNHAEQARHPEKGANGSHGTNGGHCTPDNADEEMNLVVRRGWRTILGIWRTALSRRGLVEIPQGGGAHSPPATRWTCGAPIIFQRERRADPWMGCAANGVCVGYREINRSA